MAAVKQYGYYIRGGKLLVVQKETSLHKNHGGCKAEGS